MKAALNKILCIDDDPDILEIVKISLEVFGGFTLRTCLNGSDGIREASAWQPDLIISDIMMPELDGVATFKLLRQNESTLRIPIVFMTANVERSQLESYHALGAASVIEKPFDPTTLAKDVSAAWLRVK